MDKMKFYAIDKNEELHEVKLVLKNKENPSLNRFMDEWGNMVMFDEVDKWFLEIEEPKEVDNGR